MSISGSIAKLRLSSTLLVPVQEIKWSPMNEICFKWLPGQIFLNNVSAAGVANVKLTS